MIYKISPSPLFAKEGEKKGGTFPKRGKKRQK